MPKNIQNEINCGQTAKLLLTQQQQHVIADWVPYVSLIPEP
jgi:hypothetical protein